MEPFDRSKLGPFGEIHKPVKLLMWQVVIALLPGIAMTLFFFGIGVLVQIFLALSAVVVLDYALALYRKRDGFVGIADGTSAVLAIIVAISLPPYCPWWITVAGSAVASIFGKHIYGGTGQNLFNPAMVGVVFALVCFPSITTYWPIIASASDLTVVGGLNLIFGKGFGALDAVSGATLLEYERTQVSLAVMRSEFSSASFYGVFAERGWEWVNVAYLFGGIFLCVRRVIKLTIPLWFLGTIFAVAAIAHGFDSARYAGPGVHTFAGATMLCAFFVATDPVSSPTGRVATIIYSVLLAISVFWFRHHSAYPDGVAFSVILLNALVPLLDRLFPRQIYGH
ncbi:MAG: RnfABCDGE type electron transport complex subunit D [Gammaproteobacteria bacterium]